MNVSRIFIERPVMAALVTFSILLFGILGYRALPVAALPSVDYPTISVNAGLPGANPETMASSVATPLERQFSTISGIQSMSSTNSQGSTAISIQFTLDRNIDAAAQDVQAAISKAAGQLPATMPRPPSFQKTNPADQPVLYLSLTSDTLPAYTVDEYAETLLSQRISMASGVSQVLVYGAQKYAVRVELNPDELMARNIGIDEVQRAVQQNNVNEPTGRLQGDKQAFTIQSSGQLMNAAAYRPMVVAYRNGTPVRLEQLGRVIDGTASAGNQHSRGGGQRQSASPSVPHRDSACYQAGSGLRRIAIYPEFDPRCRVHPRPDHLPGGDGHLPVPAQSLRHADSGRGGSALHHRHVRRHVSAEL
jgi:HAE1 family hydrophobic/amphiphilic exporter-1